MAAAIGAPPLAPRGVSGPRNGDLMPPAARGEDWHGPCAGCGNKRMPNQTTPAMSSICNTKAQHARQRPARQRCRRDLQRSSHRRRRPRRPPKRGGRADAGLARRCRRGRRVGDRFIDGGRSLWRSVGGRRRRERARCAAATPLADAAAARSAVKSARTDRTGERNAKARHGLPLSISTKVVHRI